MNKDNAESEIKRFKDAVCNASISVQRLGVAAVVSGDDACQRGPNQCDGS